MARPGLRPATADVGRHLLPRPSAARRRDPRPARRPGELPLAPHPLRPLTEEPAKLWPLLIPAFARRITRENAVRCAVALGLGFGIGEIGFIAQLIYADGDFNALPWYNFSGFINERFMVCLIHGGFVTSPSAAGDAWAACPSACSAR
ncbi:MAG: hypothetical protein U0232_20545 [Thermomicrobiales bacterium]